MNLGTFRLTGRGPRAHFMARLVARETARELARLQRPAPAPPVADLAELFERIWRRHRDRLWSVSELRAFGYVEQSACRPLGYALSRLVRDGGRAGRFELRRVGEDRGGAVYAVTLAVTRGDFPADAAKNRPSLRGRE